MKAILLSGGMDSVALAYWRRPDIAMTIDYGQIAASAELRAASAVAEELRMSHRIVRADCRHLGRGQMAGGKRMVGAPSPEWWPFRNQLLITLGVMQLASAGVEELMIGSVSNDAPHSDGREDFVDAMDRVVHMQEFGPRISAPAIKMTTVELVKESGIPLDILAWAHSCHVSDVACGTCRGCNKHRDTYAALGLIEY